MKSALLGTPIGGSVEGSIGGGRIVVGKHDHGIEFGGGGLSHD